MAKADQGTVRIKWIRSGIAFNRNQEQVVRALGLRRLQQVVERPDTPVVRGLIAKVRHLIEVMGPAKPEAWASVAEYTITAPPKPVETTTPVVEAESEPAVAEPAEAAPVEPVAADAEPQQEPQPKRRVRTPKAKPAAEEAGAAKRSSAKRKD